MKYKQFNGGMLNDVTSEINKWLESVGDITILHTETTYHDVKTTDNNGNTYTRVHNWKTVNIWYKI
jgi:hypothetical protein